MKAILINPFLDYLNIYCVNRVSPPISLAHIAALLRQNKIPSTIIDATALKIKSKDSIWPSLKADFFIITTASVDRWQCPNTSITQIDKIIDKIQDKNPNSYVLLTGPHPTTKPESFIKNKNIIAIRGEPESICLDVILAIKGKKDLISVKGISFLQNKKIRHTLLPNSSDFDLLPIPAYDLLPMKKYFNVLMGKHFSLMETSRGCPFNCTFCSKIMYPKKVIFRDLNIVIKEVEYLIKKQKVRNIEFIDLDFCLDKKRAIFFCKETINKKLRFNWAIQTRADSIDEELMTWLKKAGCGLIQYGVESGSQKTLNEMRKQLNLEQVKHIFDLTKKHNIKVLAYFILGSPGEKEVDILRTIEFAKYLDLDYASFVPLTIYEGSLYKKSQSTYEKNMKDILGKEKLDELVKSANLSYYLRPRYILKQLLAIRNLNDLVIIMKGFFAYFLPLLSLKRK